jgi:hypothetical protein
MSETVIREVTKNVWTFSRPFTRSGFIPFGGRSTAIKLRDGGVFVMASTQLDAETKAKIDELGPVQYIVGINAVHYLYLGEFKKAYPTAKLYAPVEATQVPETKGLTFDGAWGRDPAGTTYPFEDEVKAVHFSGYKNKDVVYYHVDSKVLLEADLIFNLPATEQYSKTKMSGKFPILGSISPSSWLQQKSVGGLGVDKEAMRRDAKTVAGWDISKIIPCHGNVIETDGTGAWKKGLKPFLA